MPRRIGRPSKYTEALGNEILERLANGESTPEIFDGDDRMPDRRTFYRWLASDESFRHRYEQAKATMIEGEVAEIRSIPDQLARKPDVSMVDVNVAKLRVDARKWRAARLAPKKYGDRQTVEIENPQDVARQIREALDAVEETDAA